MLLRVKPQELLNVARGLPRWDAVIVTVGDQQYPRLHITWHDAYGFVVHCFEDKDSWGFFLVEALSFSPPEIEIEVGGQALEKWPRQLFVASERTPPSSEPFPGDRKAERNLQLGANGCVSSPSSLGDCCGRLAWEKSREKTDPQNG